MTQSVNFTIVAVSHFLSMTVSAARHCFAPFLRNSQLQMKLFEANILAPSPIFILHVISHCMVV